MVKDNSENYSKKSFESFIENLYNATKKYDQYNELNGITNVKFRDFLKTESKKTIKQDFSEFVKVLINSDKSFNIQLIDKIAKNLNIDYELSKKEIKDYWFKNTYYYLKEQSNSTLKTKLNSDEFQKFIVSNLKNNSEVFINSLEKLAEAKKQTQNFISVINLINKVIEDNPIKLNKIENITNILCDISDKVSYKIDLSKEKIAFNENAYNTLKKSFEGQNDTNNILVNAKLLTEEKERNINSNIKNLVSVNKDLIDNILELKTFKESNIDRD